MKFHNSGGLYQKVAMYCYNGNLGACEQHNKHQFNCGAECKQHA